VGFDVQGQAPFAIQGSALCRCGKPGALHRQAGQLGAAQEDIVGAVGNFLYHDPIDDRRVDVRGCGISGTVQRHAAGQQSATNCG